MLTCCSFMRSWMSSSLTRRIVYWLSHWIVTWEGGAIPRRAVGDCRSICRDDISRLAKRASFAACERARSSASVVEVVTVSCLLALYEVMPLKRHIANACELRRSSELSAKLVSEATKRLLSLLPGSALYCRESPRVCRRYQRARSAAL